MDKEFTYLGKCPLVMRVATKNGLVIFSPVLKIEFTNLYSTTKGDGFCDAMCNVSLCEWDGGDCQKKEDPAPPIQNQFSENHHLNTHHSKHLGFFNLKFLPLFFH